MTMTFYSMLSTIRQMFKTRNVQSFPTFKKGENDSKFKYRTAGHLDPPPGRPHIDGGGVHLHDRPEVRGQAQQGHGGVGLGSQIRAGIHSK